MDSFPGWWIGESAMRKRAGTMGRGASKRKFFCAMVALVAVGCSHSGPSPKQAKQPGARRRAGLERGSAKGGRAGARSEAGSVQARPVARVGDGRMVVVAPDRFKENFSLLRQGKKVGEAFLGLGKTAKGWAFSYRSRARDALGPLYQRDRIEFGARFEIVEALLSRTRQVAPKLPLVRLWRFKPAGSRKTQKMSRGVGERAWTLDHWAFGYHWAEEMTLPADSVPVGRLWLIGAGLLVRRYDWAKGGTQVFTGVDFEKGATLGLEVVGKGRADRLSLTVRLGNRTAQIDYDPVRGGPVRVTTFDGGVYEAGAKPFSVPYVQVPARAVDVQVFAWPAQVAQKDVQTTGADGLVLNGSLALPKGKAKALAILVPAMGRLDRDGAIGPRRPYAELAARLVQELGWAVLRYDRRGVGASAGKYGAITMESEAADLSAWVGWVKKQAVLRWTPLVLLAHAEGAYPALFQAAKMGRKLRALVFLEPVGRPYDRILVDRFLREWHFGGLDQKVIATRKAYLEQSLAAIRKGTFQGSPWLARPALPVAWLKEVMDLRLRRLGRRVRCPVLLLRGGADIFSTDADSRAMVKALGGRRRVSLPRPVGSVGRFFQRSPYGLEVAPEEWFVPSPVDAGYFAVLADWLRRLR